MKEKCLACPGRDREKSKDTEGHEHATVDKLSKARQPTRGLCFREGPKECIPRPSECIRERTPASLRHFMIVVFCRPRSQT